MFDGQAFYGLLLSSLAFCGLCGIGYVVVVSISRTKRGLRPKLSHLEGLALILVVTGVQFLIFGTVYTVTSQGFVAWYSGAPWNVPVEFLQPGPGATLNIDYSLNYLGAALLVIGSMVGIASWRMLKPHGQPMQPSIVDHIG